MANQQTDNVKKGQDAELADVSVESLSINGTPVEGGVALGAGQVVDLQGEADALVLDADNDTTISAPADDQIDIEINGADDFRFTANKLTALAGSSFETDTLNETTPGSGVTADGLLIKDGHVGAVQAITGDGAITIQTGMVVLSKGSAAAITIAAPTAGDHDGIEITVVTLTAQAHVITQGTVGFNAKGSSGTVTFTAAIGNAVVLRAYNGNWYAVVKTGVTVA